MKDIESYYLSKEEPNKGCLLALRALILKSIPELTEAWKYKMPFFCYKNKMLVYLWIDKTTDEPYIGFVEGKSMEDPMLEGGNRSRMKIFRVNPNFDFDQEKILRLLNRALEYTKMKLGEL